MKKALITYKKNLNLKDIIDYKRKLIYDHFFIISEKNKISDKEFSPYSKKFTIIITENLQDIPKHIDNTIDKFNKKFTIYPYFAGDAKSKFNIRVYNRTFNTKISPDSFRLKNKMNKFLGPEITNKKTIKMTYEEVAETTYSKIKKELGSIFILKPINAASSLLNFRISSNAMYKEAKQQLKKKYDYVVEEYLDGTLYSIDFFCDGKNIFIYNYAREIPFLEIIDKLSKEYIDKYKESLTDKFLHFLPIQYTLTFDKLKPYELDFINKVGKQLKKQKYHGIIHLEYKAKHSEEKIGFIEWGARAGGKRLEFTEGAYNYRIENLPSEILHKKDFNQFTEKSGLYFLKNRNIDKNFLMIKTNVLRKTHVTKILKKIPNFLKVSFEDFLKNYLWDNWKIKVKNIEFFVITSDTHNFHPFYERSDTRFNYIMEFEEIHFKNFLKKKHKILEHLVFHDYIK